MRPRRFVSLIFLIPLTMMGAAPTTPSVFSVAPNSVQVGGPAFTIVVNGSNFAPGVAVTWNGGPLQTTYISSTQLSAVVTPDLITFVGSANISVLFGGVSPGGVPLTISGDGVVSISSVSPQGVVPGGRSFTLYISGSGFLNGAIIVWSGLGVQAVVDSPTQMHGLVGSNMIAGPGNASISIWSPNGARSPAFLFPVSTIYAPTITSISPNTVLAGSQALTVAITGSNFSRDSVAMVGPAPLSTSLISSNQVSAIVPANLLSSAGSVSIQVKNPEGSLSNVMAISITNAAPFVVSLSPAVATAGDAAFRMAVTGTNFLSGTTVQWNGAPLPTDYSSRNLVTASVPAALVANAGTARVAVMNPDGVVSNAVTFTINPGVSALTNIAPSSAAAGGPSFLLTANGANFPNGAAILWNGTALNTSFVSASQLTATVPASLVAATGTAAVSVSSGGVTTQSVPFTITPALPTTSQSAIVNAASATPSIAPGSLISIYGSNLGTGNSTAGSTPLPYSLGGTSVTVNGTSVPLLFVGPFQINGQLPFEIAPGTASMVIQANGTKSAAVSFQVQATAPGILTLVQNNHALALNIPDNSLNSTQQPAIPGQYVTIYMTGQGLVDPSVPTGTAAPSGPFSRPLAEVAATIGGMPAEIQFAGLAPGFVGLLQINLKVPAISAGEQSLAISIGSKAAPASVLSIGAAAN